VPPLAVPDLVERRAWAAGALGRRWLRDLPDVVASLAQRWDLAVGETLVGGTAALVVAVSDANGRPCVLKVALPVEVEGDDVFARAVRVHQVAAGRGCAELLAHDAAVPAMLLERLGPNLGDLGLGVAGILDAVTATLRTFWRPMDPAVEFPSGADKADWLAAYITTTWERCGRPCEHAVVDRALRICGERAAAFDPARAVLVHADAHGWNTLADGHGAYKFVDPEGLWAEPEHDLSVVMREYNEPLLAGDTRRLVRARAAYLAERCGLDADAIWEWGFVERVSTGLANLEHVGPEGAAPFFAVAERCA
jgi:streptomycin 6-kinase